MKTDGAQNCNLKAKDDKRWLAIPLECHFTSS